MNLTLWICLWCFAIAASDQCPKDHYLEMSSSTWYRQCISPDECRKRNMVIDGLKCLKSCSRASHFFDKDTRTCYENCPIDRVVEGHHCINKQVCSNKEQVVLRGTCADKCFVPYPLLHDAVCYQQCPSGLVANGTTCLRKNKCIDSGSFVYNHTCVESCPITSGFTKEGICLSSCPKGSVINGQTCIDTHDCAQMNKVILNKTCLIECPSVAPYNVSDRCYDNCPSSYVLDSSTCIPDIECKRKLKVVYEGLCVDVCPTEAPLQVEDEITCRSNCPEGNVRLNMSCISETKCSSLSGLYHFVYNGTCVESCPSSAPLDQNHVCGNECKESYFKDGISCITGDECRSTGFIYNRTCVSNCPENIPIIYDRECRNDCKDNLLQNGTSCIHEGDYHGLVYNRICVSQCPDNSPLVSDRTCLDQCPQGKLEYKERCINEYECTKMNAFQFEGKCVEECPSEAPFQCNNICLMNCTSLCVRKVEYEETHEEGVLRFNNSKCLSRKACNDQGMFEYNYTCMPSCPKWTILKPNGYGYVCVPAAHMYWVTAIIAVCFIMCLIISIRLCYIPGEKEHVGTEKQEQETVNPDDDVFFELNDAEENLGLNQVDENPRAHPVDENPRANPEEENPRANAYCENLRVIDEEQNGSIDREFKKNRMNKGKEITKTNEKRTNKRITLVDFHSLENERLPLIDSGDEGSDDSELIEV